MTKNLHSAQITNKTVASITGQYFDYEKPFAFPRRGNLCVNYHNGRDYFSAVADSIRQAKSSILITDWQLDYDVELERRGEAGHPGRLSELLASAIQRGVHVRIMLYDAINMALDTHEEIAQDAFGRLKAGSGSIQIMLQNPNTGKSNVGSYNFPGKTRSIVKYANQFFSHHQKSVIIDGNRAFIGGIDLAYGRWDTNEFNVVIDPATHVINDAYNAQLNPSRTMNAAELALTKDIAGRPGFQTSYADGKVLDEQYQPRQPWQDAALQIDGPAAYDVFVNFILRWNSFAGEGTNTFDSAMESNWFAKANGPSFLVDPLKAGKGSVTVQICRSASSAQLKDELVLWDERHRYIHDEWKKPDPARRKVVRAARALWASEHQTSILDAMVNCIRAAQGFIYIENQFFMSDCGSDELGASCPSKNKIIAELAAAVGRAIYAERPFHVWLVLPEHPEGKMEEAGTASQTWWALQGVKRGRNSLINRINATLLKKHGKAWGIDAAPAVNQGVRDILAAHGMAEEWKKYLTVLNLRNYGFTKNHALSEMIYVHSKLLIVDDAVAIIGSANINDRSLNGNGDTELAAVVVDTADGNMTDVGGGIRIITRRFARELRIGQWKKHLGMLIEGPTTGVHKQLAAPNAIDLEKPLSPATILGLQTLASGNRQAYNDVFIHTPRDSYKTLAQGRDLAYPQQRGQNTRDFSCAPSLQPSYSMKKSIDVNYSGPGAPPPSQKYLGEITIQVHNVALAKKILRMRVQGFFVSMPLDWGSGEKKSPKAPVSPAMIAVNDRNSTQKSG